jgi:uncharacterized protein (DUF305 family)
MVKTQRYSIRGIHAAWIYVASAVLALAIASTPQGTKEAAFIKDNANAMDKMMSGMAIAPSGDIDRDFALMMIPHHQGAIDMARAELQYGSDETLRRIAQGMVVEQQQEITAMRMTLERHPEHR